MSFELPLKGERSGRKHATTLHLVVIFTFFATSIFLFTIKGIIQRLPAESQDKFLPLSMPTIIPVSIIALASFLLAMVVYKNSWVNSKPASVWVRAIELAFVLCFAGFAIHYNLTYPAVLYGIVSAAILFAIYWEGITDNILYISVDERGIRFPITSKKKFLPWHDVQNVLLRFGILTIDCYDNRLFQWNLREINFNKEDFQKFCTEHISLSKDRREKLAGSSW
jgi:hypothetical protein